MDKYIKDYIRKEGELINNSQSLQVRTEGKDRPIASLNEMHEYASLFGMLPNATSIGIPNGGYDGRKLNELMQKPVLKEWFLFKQYNSINGATGDEYPYGQLWVNTKHKLLLSISLNILEASSVGYWVSPHENMDFNPERGSNELDDQDNNEISESAYNHLRITDLTILNPPVWHVDYNTEEIIQLAKSFQQIKREDGQKAKIGIVSASQGDYYVKDFSMENKIPKLTDMDLHYGESFTEFNNSLITRLKDNTKGLILFHGDPGTGKTHYIRYLLGELSKIDKTILYFSPAMAERISSPEMMSFLSTWIAEQDKDCIILIEDAEPLLESRTGGNRTEGITNLLNMTDGILNDMLGITVIATFNISIHKIDSALLRPERLIARKQFVRINKENGTKLLQKLGIESRTDIQWPTTLADIYSKRKENEILFHGVQEEQKIGFGQK